MTRRTEEAKKAAGAKKVAKESAAKAARDQKALNAMERKKQKELKEKSKATKATNKKKVNIGMHKVEKYSKKHLFKESDLFFDWYLTLFLSKKKPPLI